VIETLALHKSWIVFVGTFFLGESVVLTSSALAAHGSWSVAAVAVWAFAGTVLSDTVWFRSATIGLNRWSAGEKDERMIRLAARLDRLGGDRPYRVLLFAKFVYGTRIASLAYMAARKVPLRKFIIFDAVGTLFWLAVMIPLGWAIGRGLDNLGTDLKRLEGVILTAVLLAAAIKGGLWWRARR
jgi:membrane protein DedA with SNARE-associated domain